jgi:hypothetical protein
MEFHGIDAWVLKTLKIQAQHMHAESAVNCILPNICRTLQYFIISKYLCLVQIVLYINANKNV